MPAQFEEWLPIYGSYSSVNRHSICCKTYFMCVIVTYVNISIVLCSVLYCMATCRQLATIHIGAENQSWVSVLLFFIEYEQFWDYTKGDSRALAGRYISVEYGPTHFNLSRLILGRVHYPGNGNSKSITTTTVVPFQPLNSLLKS